MIQAGNRVRFVKMPDWVAELPEESRRIFEFCLGRIYLVKEVEERGLCVIDVSPEVDERFGGFMNDLRLEEDCLELL